MSKWQKMLDFAIKGVKKGYKNKKPPCFILLLRNNYKEANTEISVSNAIMSLG